MKKIILSVCAALMLFCGGASAKVSTMTSNFFVGSKATYDVETGKFEWTTSTNNWMNLFTNLNGQLSKYKHLKINLTEATHGYRLLFYKGNENVIKVMAETETDVNLDLTQLELKDGWTIDDIDRICISGLDGNGTLTLKPADVTLETDDIETLTVTTTVDANSDINTPFLWYKGSELRNEPVTNNIGKTGDAVLWGYGSNNDEAHGYFNLNGYSALLVKVKNFDATKTTAFRVLSPDNGPVTITMTGDETLVPCSVSKCTSLKSSAYIRRLSRKSPPSTSSVSIRLSTQSLLSLSQHPQALKSLTTVISP